MATIVDDVHAANGLFLTIYTNNNSETDPAMSYEMASQYFEPDYLIGSMQVPPCNIQFVPFTMVIDLETMNVLVRDTMFAPLSVQQILNQVTQANS